MFKSIVRNLLSNAGKYCPQGGDIWITASAKPDMHHHTIIAISNSGDVIAPNLRQDLFKKCMSSQTGTTGEQGSGIGLMLCSQYLFERGCDIWVDDRFTEGTKICFSLPAP